MRYTSEYKKGEVHEHIQSTDSWHTSSTPSPAVVALPVSVAAVVPVVALGDGLAARVL